MFFTGRFDLLPEDPFLLSYVGGSSEYPDVDFSKVERLFEIEGLTGEGELGFTLNTSDQIVEKYRNALNRVKKSTEFQQVLAKWGLN